MQNWRIKRMSDKELGASIKACNKFLHVYKKGDCFGSHLCLFCDVSLKFHHKHALSLPLDRAKKCDFCLWKIIEAETCEDFSKREFDDLVAGVKGTERWFKLRLPMLRRWKKILKAELDGRTEGGGEQ